MQNIKPIEFPKKNWEIESNKLVQGFNTLLDYFRINDRRQEFIHQLDKKIQEATDSLEAVYNFILKEGLEQERIGTYRYILKIKDEKLIVRAANTNEVLGKEYSIDEILSGKAINIGKTLNIANVKAEKAYREVYSDTQSTLIIPIKDHRAAKTLGVLNIEHTEEREFSPSDVEYCELLAGQLAIAIEHARIWKGVKLISDFSSQLLSGEEDISIIYQKMLIKLLNILDFDLGQIMLLNQREQCLMIMANAFRDSNTDEVSDAINTKLYPNKSVCATYIIEQKGAEVLNIDDLKKSKYLKFYGNILDNKEKMNSELVFPLKDSEGEVIGVLNIEDSRHNAFSTFDEHILSILAVLIGKTIEAGIARRAKKKKQNAVIQDEQLAHLVDVGVDSLHKIGGIVSDAKFKINLLLKKMESNVIHKELQEIAVVLRSSEQQMKSFKMNFNPDHDKIIPQNIDLINLLNKVITAFNLKNQQVTAQLNKSGQLNRIDCLLTDRFEAVIDAILNNAAEAMPNGGLISVGVGFKGLLEAEITITDQGVGMTDDTQKKIFQFGYTTKRHHKGQGMGMWYVKTHIDRLAGNIRFESSLNKGTTFYITIPVSIK